MNKYQLFLALAYAYKQQVQGRDIALVTVDWKIIAIGIDTRGHTDGAGTPIANVLHNVAHDETLDAAFIFATYDPTELCLGMARICRIRSVITTGNNVYRRFNTNNPPSPGGFLPNLISPAEIKQVKINPIKTAPDIAKNIPDVAKDPDVTRSAWWDALKSASMPEWYDQVSVSFLSAKVCSGITIPELPGIPRSQGPTWSNSRNLRDSFFMLTAYTIVSATWDRIDEWKGNKVACILVDPLDRIVSWGLNLGESHSATWHGETVTLMRFLRSQNRAKIPKGYRLYTTLKPCHMCAGLITLVAESMTIVYGQNDPQIVNSALDRNKGNFPQFRSTAQHSLGKSFPDLLQDLLSMQVDQRVIPFLQNMPKDICNGSFRRAEEWLHRINDSMNGQQRWLPSNEATLSGRLAYLDLAAPSRTEIAANLEVLRQALGLLESIRSRAASILA